jgi:PAS domain S-box-containing protein
MATDATNTGISVIGEVPWGTHFCLFYETRRDLLDALVPFFRAGMENDEVCLWVISDPAMEDAAWAALRSAIPAIDRHRADRQVEIVSGPQWYLTADTIDLDEIIVRWHEKLAQALAAGHSGLRVSGDTQWLPKRSWSDFRAYENALNGAVLDRPITVLCTYPLGTSGAGEVLDVARAHQLVTAKRNGRWEALELPSLKQTKAEIQSWNEELERRVVERTRELATANDELRRQIADRQRAEANVTTQNEIVQTIFDHIPVMINFIDEKFQIKLVNRAWERTLGWTLEEILTKKVDVLAEAYPDPAHREAALRFVIESNGEWAEFKTTVKDGRVIDTSWAVVHLSDGTIIGIGQDITERKRADAERSRLFDQVRARREELQVLSRQLLQTQEAERRAVARELHDEIGQLLTSVGFVLTTSEARLTEAQTLVYQLIQQVRNLTLDLHPSMLDVLGLLPSLTSLVERYSAQTNVAVRFEHPGMEEQRFAPEIETAAYRIIQEALTNVARHAGVSEATVRLSMQGSALFVSIEDRGSGFDVTAARAGASSGLAGMHERMALLGGSLTIDSAPGTGTSVAAVLPIEARARDSDPPSTRVD